MKKIMICLLSAMMLVSCSLNDSKSLSSAVDNKTINEENTNKEKAKLSSKEEESTQEIIKKVKDYINKGQNGKPEASKLKWSKTFLDKVDISSLYERYVDNAGDSKNIEKFAEYITLNAPKPDNWQELFKEDLKNIYGEEVIKLEHLDGDLYEAYVNKDGREVPYVVVSSRTGYFHG